MIFRLTIWFFERFFEMLGAAVILRVIYGPTGNSQYLEGSDDIISIAKAVFVFYFLSGYLASVVYFGLYRRRNATKQALLVSSAFLMHFLLFFVFFNQAYQTSNFVLAGLGFLVVLTVNFLGSLLLNSIRRWPA